MRLSYRRTPFTIVAALLLLVTGSNLPVTAQEAPVSPEQQLIDRYVPVVYIREQRHPCAPTPDGGEPYLPVPVELVLDNERVLLRDAANGDRVLATGVSAGELATYGPNTYLDFPGDARRPGCTFETDERVRTAELGLVPTAYARIVTDAENRRVMIQYWLFWYFNDWNNLHEADWEGVLIFWDDAGSVEEALAVPPDRVGFSQHGGGELANWNDAKLQLDGETHPRAYPAAGSHANFFSSQTFLGWGENGSGFGCDVSNGPSTRTELTAVLLPEDPDPNGDFAWLLYPGRWGERQPSVFNGVHGPGFNSRWRDPWGTTDRWRTSSIVVPGSNSLGPTMTDAFCTLTHLGSMALIYTIVFPWLLIPASLIVLGLLAFFYRRSRDVFRRAIRLYGSEWRLFVGIGLVAVPIGIVMNLVQRLVIRFDPLAYVIDWLDDTAGARLTTVLAIGGVQQLAMLLIVSPAVIQAVADIEAGQKPGVVRSYRLALERVGAIVAAVAIMIVLIALPLLIVIGLPVAIWLLVRWQFYNQVIIFDRNAGGVDALRESGRLVKNRWWKTLFALAIFDIIAVLPGILVGFGLLTLGRTAVGFANGISSLLYALLIPLSVVAVTLLYLDRRAERSAGLDGAVNRAV